MRVLVIKKPPQHATGDDSPKCTCKGKKGNVIGLHGDIAIIKFDGKGRAGIPKDCLKVLK